MKSSLKKKAFLLVLVVVLVNTFTSYIWFQLKVMPMIRKNEQLQEIIMKQELQTNYDSLKSVLEDISSISKKYAIKVILKDVEEHELIGNSKNKSDILLFSDVIIVAKEMYSITVYNTKNISVVRMMMQLIVFQIVIVSLCMVMIFAITRSKIIKPVDRIIEDIRNYKLGKKSKRRKVHNEFDLIQNEFVNLVDSLEQEKREQNRIIASISHDIKTPLTSIIGYATLIDESTLTKEEMKKYNYKIKEKSLTMKEILSSFDDYLVNQTNQKLKLDVISIEDLVDDLNHDYKVDLESHGILFSVHTKLAKERIQVDVLKMKRIFANIITNSIRYLKEDGKITIEITRDEKFYRFKIADNGPGVEETLIDNIFDPLFTTDSSRKISGLGLSIVKEFILMHHGEVRAYNELGFVIEFTIPSSIS